MVQSVEFELLKKALSSIPSTRVILFGSRARGTARNDSDYDVLIVMDHSLSHKEKFRLASALRKSLAQSHIDADIFIRSEEEVAMSRELRGSIVRNALMEGVDL